MSRLATALDALTSRADSASTLLAFTIEQRIEYPFGHTCALERDQRKELRRLERAARTAMKQPPTTLYSVLSGPVWHVLLAPAMADERIYLARAECQHPYQRSEDIEAPMAPPATLLASWHSTARHCFPFVATAEQLALLMHYSTAAQHVYLSPLAPMHGCAEQYTAVPTGPRPCL